MPKTIEETKSILLQAIEYVERMPDSMSKLSERDSYEFFKLNDVLLSKLDKYFQSDYLVK